LITLRSRCFEGRTVQVHEGERVVLGFSEIDFTATALQRFLKPLPLLFLKQTHSAIVLKDRDWLPVREGDGLLLEKPGAVAVVQTADCLPLFYFAEDGTAGGVVHVGWRGLFQGIELKLLEMLPGKREKYSFFLGPAIEKKCYPVGEELVAAFGSKPYGKSIFSPGCDGRQRMDIKTGLILSLRHAGVGADRIQDSGLCTYCLPGRFPSYRRDGKTGKRIFNFLALR
jgi:hypothetical protein